MSNAETYFYCPACGKADHIDVETSSSVRVNSEGEIDWHYDDNGSSHDWDGSSGAHCSDCGYDGAWTDFQHLCADEERTKLVQVASRVATGGLEILSDGQLSELFKGIALALRVAQSRWRQGELGGHEAVSCLQAKLSAIDGEMNCRGMAQ